VEESSQSIARATARCMFSLLTLKEKKSHQQLRSSSGHTFDVNSLIYARNCASGPKWLPGNVIRKLGRVTYYVRTDRGIWNRHQNQLQPRLDDVPAELKDGGFHGTPKQEPLARSPERRADVVLAEPQRVPQRRYPLRVRKRPEFFSSLSVS